MMLNRFDANIYKNSVIDNDDDLEIVEQCGMLLNGPGWWNFFNLLYSFCNLSQLIANYKKFGDFYKFMS